MKKALLILVLAMVVAGGIFAQVFKPDLVPSAGVASGFEFYNTTADSGNRSATAVPLLLYYDVTYVTLSAGISFVTAKDEPQFNVLGSLIGKADVSRVYMPLGLLLKYPLTFGANRNIRIYPQAGIEWRLFLSDDYGTREEWDDLYSTRSILNTNPIDNYSAEFLDQFSIVAGLGGEVDLPAIGGLEGLYIRFNGLVDLQIPSKKELDTDDSTKHFGMKFQLAVGYKMPTN
ncbi:hypothetical protein FACS1894147_08730 [Spirochaetia bacterium]|nr:hypothetical protein FACS1894147_08730 [Spirochaetia bacterium]